MALLATIKEVEFGVGDRIRVHQRIKDGDKTREAIFEGMVLGISGRENKRTFTVRRIGEANVGIEKIFPIDLPSIEKISIVKRGVEGVRRSKLYYTRVKAPTEIEMIYKKAAFKRSTKQIEPKVKKVRIVKAAKLQKQRKSN